MTDAKRPGGRTARVRAQILAATVDLIARDGITGFRYEEVAERAGVHKTSVYRNWPDRDELAVEAMSQYAHREVPFPDTGDLRTDLVEFLLGLTAELDTSFGRAVLSAVYSRECEAVARAVHGVLDQRMELVRVRLERATERGELPPIDTSFFVQLVFGPVHLYRNLGYFTFGRAEAERVVDVVIAGIKATSQTPTDRH